MKTEKNIINIPVTINAILQFSLRLNGYTGTLKAVAIFTVDYPSLTALNQTYTPFKKEFPNMTVVDAPVNYLNANEHYPFEFL